MSYQVPQHIDKNKIFIVNRSEIEGRLDAQYYNENLDFSGFIKLSSVAVVKGGNEYLKVMGIQKIQLHIIICVLQIWILIHRLMSIIL